MGCKKKFQVYKGRGFGAISKSNEAVVIMSWSGNAVSSLIAFLAIGAIIGGANGKPPSRIIGGRMATDSEFRGIVSLTRPGDTFHSCGGAIIGSRYILTAAHCVDHGNRSAIAVHAGAHDIEDRKNVVERLVERIYIHPDYVSFILGQRPMKNDIAILMLTEDLPFGEHIQPFRLPTHQPDRSVSYTLGGWGRSSQEPVILPTKLKALPMTLGNARTCDGFAPKVICAYSERGAPCYGDSGSPLIHGDYVYGIVSTVSCDVRQTAGFTNVYDFVYWIQALVPESF